MNKKQMKSSLHVENKICPECGQALKEHMSSYLLECDRCLSKKAE